MGTSVLRAQCRNKRYYDKSAACAEQRRNKCDLQAGAQVLEVLRTSLQCRISSCLCSCRAGWTRDEIQSCSAGLQLAFDWVVRQEQSCRWCSQVRFEARGPSAVFGIMCLLRFKLSLELRRGSSSQALMMAVSKTVVKAHIQSLWHDFPSLQSALFGSRGLGQPTPWCALALG
jgi:hypothetical protein